eukprot:118877-Chlamydomonas_euryale.AAC.1
MPGAVFRLEGCSAALSIVGYRRRSFCTTWHGIGALRAQSSWQQGGLPTAAACLTSSPLPPLGTVHQTLQRFVGWYTPHPNLGQALARAPKPPSINDLIKGMP